MLRQPGDNENKNAFDLYRKGREGDGTGSAEDSLSHADQSLFNGLEREIQAASRKNLVEGLPFLEGFEISEGESDFQPDWSAIQQGQIPDCHFVASTQAMARHPEGQRLLKEMIEPAEDPENPGKKAWQVKFPGADKPVLVTEDELHPQGAKQLDADYKPLAGLQGDWPVILETAAGKLWAEKAGAEPYRYPAMQLANCGSVEWSLSLLTGNKVSPEATRMEMTIGEVNELADSSYLNKLMVVVSGFERSPAELENLVGSMADKDPYVVFGRNGHAYTLVGYTPGLDGEEGTFSLRNPWGGKNAERIHDLPFSDGTADGILNLKVSEVQKLFDQIYILKNPPGTGAFKSKRG